MRARKWGRTWLTAALCALVLLSGWEAFWRQRGFEPTVSDDHRLWSIARRQASRLGPQGVVLAGSSRIQVGLNPDAFEAETGIRPVMLAIDGSTPLPVLEHLAADPHFDSRVIVSLIPMFLAEPAPEDRALEWVRAHEEQKWSSRIEARLSLTTQRFLAFRNNALAPDELWTQLKAGAWPKVPYAPMRPDRYRPGFFERADVAALRRSRAEREREIHAAVAPLSEQRFLARVDRIKRMAAQIEQRGGAVAFVRFPSGGIVRRLEGEDWPRRRYWDVFAGRVDSICIHYEDHPALQGYRLPDHSHLAIAEARRFTRELVGLLAQKGFLSRVFAGGTDCGAK
jgi:hypothetical protein